MGARISVSSDDWNEHWTTFAEAAELNPAQAYRRKLIFDALALTRATSPVRLVDLGSGTGDLASEVLRIRPDADVVGLDLSASGVDIAQKKVPCAHFFEQDFTRPISVPEAYRGWATHAVCSEVLEHLDDPASMLRNVRALFAHGCRLVVTVPAGPMSAFDRHIGHRRHFRPADLERTLRAAGLQVTDLRGAGFPFFNVYRLAVVARGAKLIDDTDTRHAELPFAARAAMRLFSGLFRFNVTSTTLGWQLVAVGIEG